MRIEQIGSATLYHGDCREIVLNLSVADAVITDPPYGMGWNPDSTRFSGGLSPAARGRGVQWRAVHGDDKPFDPVQWLSYERVVLFGCNHFGQKLPVGTTLVWLKKHPPAFGAFLSDAELAWMKGGRGVYCFTDTHMNGAGANFEKLHPTQKPESLMRWVLDQARVDQGHTVLDPYMGSGTTGAACMSMGAKFIGIEIEQKYFDIACRRIEDAQRQQRLFA